MIINNIKIFCKDSFITKIFLGNKQINYNYPTSVKIDGLYLNNVKASEIVPNKTYKIMSTVLPEKTFNKTVTYTCNSSNVIINGDSIQFNSAGNYTITAKTFNNKTSNRTYEVDNPTVYPQSINIDTNLYTSNNFTSDNKASSIEVNTTYYLNATIYPSNTTDKNITYSCSDSNVIINDNIITFSKAGDYVVTASTYNGITSSVTFTAVEQEVKLQSVKLDSKLYTDSTYTTTVSKIKINTWYYLKLIPTPSNASCNGVSFTFQSQYVEVDLLDDNWIVLFKQSGNQSITIATPDNSNYSTTSYTVVEEEVQVVNPTSVTLNGLYTTSSLSTKVTDFKINTWYYLKSTVSPSNATDNSVTYSCSDSNVTVNNSNKTVKFNNSGTYSIKVTTNTGNCSNTYSVTVAPEVINPSSVSLNGLYTTSSLSTKVTNFKINTTYYLKSTVLPSNATDKSVTYSCSSSNATIDNSKDTVKFSKSGTYSIKVVTNTGSYSSTYSVTIEEVTNKLNDFSGTNDIIALAKTYYAKRDSYTTYGNTNIMTNITNNNTTTWTQATVSGTDSSDGRYRNMDCSCLVGLCIRGIAYSDVFTSKSTYNSRDLSPRVSKYDWVISELSNFPRLARDQYTYCKNKGWLLDKSLWHSSSSADDWAGLKKGDLIFFYKPSDLSVIGHVAIYYGLNSSNKPAIIECTHYSYVANHSDGITKGMCIQTLENIKNNYNSKYTAIMGVARPQL